METLGPMAIPSRNACNRCDFWTEPQGHRSAPESGGFEMAMTPAPSAELREAAEKIFKIRLEKYPATMKCAGSIFKNLILAELPESVRRQIPERVVREGKAPSAYFLEQVGAKGMRNGDIEVADYHANLIYNTGNGTARELCELIGDLKSRVRQQFGLDLEEEVQYVGFSPAPQPA